MIKTRILHFDILTGNTQLSDQVEEFYTKTLGLEVKRKNVVPGKADRRFIGNKGEDNGFMMEIVGDLSEEGEPTYFQGNAARKILDAHGPCIDHVALEVDDIDAACEALKQAGIKLDAEPYEFAGFIRMAWLRDPAGIPVELIQYMREP
jgi:catechol 2,3-dioxygenase-like lactoylglutathione lyase family enzyme